MKYLLIALALTLNIACAKSVDVAELSDRVDEIEARVELLEGQIVTNIYVLNSQANTLTVLQEILNSQEEQSEELLAAVAALEADLVEQQAAIDELVVELAVVQGYSNIESLIDPCGDGDGYDEILIKLSTGEIIAYFQHGNDRHLAILPNGSYQTTDKDKCNFTVSNGTVQ
jgi:hypothetical protein